MRKGSALVRLAVPLVSEPDLTFSTSVTYQTQLNCLGDVHHKNICKLINNYKFPMLN
jgi:hypothetical protein